MGIKGIYGSFPELGVFLVVVPTKRIVVFFWGVVIFGFHRCVDTLGIQIAECK